MLKLYKSVRWWTEIFLCQFNTFPITNNLNCSWRLSLQRRSNKFSEMKSNVHMKHVFCRNWYQLPVNDCPKCYCSLAFNVQHQFFPLLYHSLHTFNPHVRWNWHNNMWCWSKNVTLFIQLFRLPYLKIYEHVEDVCICIFREWQNKIFSFSFIKTFPSISFMFLCACEFVC
jgi:hypothetical protein